MQVTIRNIASISYKALCLLAFMALLACGAREGSLPPVVMHEMSQEHLKNIISEQNLDYQIIDVRTPAEFKNGHIESAVNIPHQKIIDDPAILKPYAKKNLVFYCDSGGRVFSMVGALSDDMVGRVYHLNGDYTAWKAKDSPLSK